MRSFPFLLLLAGCADSASGAIENQQLGRVTGFFTQVTPDNVLCQLSTIGVHDLRLVMPFGPDKKVASVILSPLDRKAERVQMLAELAYQTGESTTGAAEVERFAAIVDPRLGEESKQSALLQRTSLYFPLHVHRLRIEAARLCDTDISGGRTSDCLDVPESTMEGARFWCDVGPTTDPRFSE